MPELVWMVNLLALERTYAAAFGRTGLFRGNTYADITIWGF
jgi:hypothetical protein